MALILLRHAAPASHLQGRYYGHTDIPIDPALFDRAKIEPLLHRTFDAVYSSDLRRCTGTLKMMGITDYLSDHRLREVRFKEDVEGKTFEEVSALEGFSPSLLESEERWHGFVCAESKGAFGERIRSLLASLPKEGEILVCAHGGSIGLIASILAPSRPHTPIGYLDHIIL